MRRLPPDFFGGGGGGGGGGQVPSGLNPMAFMAAPSACGR